MRGVGRLRPWQSVFAALGLRPAAADCQPAVPNSGDTVTCSGTENNGFNAGAVGQLTVNVLTGATVNNGAAPPATTIFLNDNNTLTNNGAVNAGDDSTAIFAGSGNTITNAATGTITVGNAAVGNAFGIVVADNNIVANLGSIQLGTSCGCVQLIGISAGNNNSITNAGPISGGDGGIGIQVNDNNTVTNRNTISFGQDSIGISAGSGNTITNDIGGSITIGDAVGGAAGIVAFDNNNIANLGSIRIGSTLGGGFPVSGIVAHDGNAVTNAGSIVGGDFTAGVFANNGNTITNRGSISLGQDSAGIFAQNGNTVTNAVGASIMVGDAVFVGSFGINVNDHNAVANLGSIVIGSGVACGCGVAGGIEAGNRNTITNAGSITGGDVAFGIQAGFRNTITNSGAIALGQDSLGIGVSTQY